MHLPSHAIRPDYAGGSVLNLAATLGSHFVVSTHHAPYRHPLPLDGARHIVLIVVDALGAGQLRDAITRGDAPTLASLTPAPGPACSPAPPWPP